MRKLHIGILFGGQSTEHEISIQSAKNIFLFINKKKFDVSMIFIDKFGIWYLKKSSKINVYNKKNKISIIPKNKFPIFYQDHEINIDVIFPVLHGKYGEDGIIQGFLKTIGLPFVGSDVLSSSIIMDKEITKKILYASNIMIPPFISIKKNKYKINIFEKIKKMFGIPFFIKPSNQGSSIGISKVYSKKDFDKAIELAFSYNKKIIIEKTINGKEIECGILGNDNPNSSVCGEIYTKNNFYNYDAKYIDKKKSYIYIPAKIKYEISEKIRLLSLKIFKILECQGMARIDFFLTKKNDIIFNEVNTIPGFTKSSMYPKLWIYSGISFTNLISKLINLAIEYHKKY